VGALLVICATRALAGDFAFEVDNRWDLVGVSAQAVAVREEYVIEHDGARSLACNNPGVGPRAVRIHVVPWRALPADGHLSVSSEGFFDVGEGARTFQIYATSPEASYCTKPAEAEQQLAAAKSYAKEFGIELGKRPASVSFGPSLAPAPPCDAKSQATTTWVSDQKAATATVTSCLDSRAALTLRGTVTLTVAGVVDNRMMSFTTQPLMKVLSPPSEPCFSQLIVTDNVLLITTIDGMQARRPFIVRLK
jgi:hypothetical protein